LVAGQKIEFHLNAAGRYEIVPQLPMKAARGMFLGVDDPVENDPEGDDWPGACTPLASPVWVKPISKSAKA
jgi:hypothetical protein